MNAKTEKQRNVKDAFAFSRVEKAMLVDSGTLAFWKAYECSLSIGNERNIANWLF